MTSPRSAPSPLPAHPPRTKLPALICLGECQNPDEEGYGTRPASPDLRMIVDFSGYDPEEWDDVDPEEFAQALLDSQGGEEDMEEVAFHWMDAQGGPSDGSLDSLWIDVVLEHLTDQPDPFDLIAADAEDDDQEESSDLEALRHILSLLDETILPLAMIAREKARVEEAAAKAYSGKPRKKRWEVDGPEGQARSTAHAQRSRAASARAMRRAILEAREATRALGGLMPSGGGDQGENPVDH